MLVLDRLAEGGSLRVARCSIFGNEWYPGSNHSIDEEYDYDMLQGRDKTFEAVQAVERMQAVEKAGGQRGGLTLGEEFDEDDIRLSMEEECQGESPDMVRPFPCSAHLTMHSQRISADCLSTGL